MCWRFCSINWGSMARGGRFEHSSPLTPALSLGERADRLQRFGRSNGAWFADDLTAVLPLPNPDQSGLRSEGWGEGEQDSTEASAPDHSRTRQVLEVTPAEAGISRMAN